MNYNIWYIFRKLNIDPTTDQKLIKKAYSTLIKKYHPEEYPEEWKEIHAAYQAAIKYAKQDDSIINLEPNMHINADPVVYTGEEPDINSEQEQNIDLSMGFVETISLTVQTNSGVDFDSLLTSHKEYEQECNKKVLVWLKEIEDKKGEIGWLDLMESVEFQHAYANVEILEEWRRVLVKSPVHKRDYDRIMAVINQLQEKVSEQLLVQGIPDASQVNALLERGRIIVGSTMKPPLVQPTSKSKTIFSIFFFIAIILIIMSFTNTTKQTSKQEPSIPQELLLNMQRSDADKAQIKKDINSYLDVKYGEQNFEVSDSDIIANSYITNTYGTQATLPEGHKVWEWEATSGKVYFDDVQKQEIIQSFKAEMQKRTGISDMILQFGYGVSVLTKPEWVQKSAFHEKFDQDLKDFADREAAFRNTTVPEQLEQESENGTVIVYFNDPDSGAMGLLSANRQAGALGFYEQVLTEIEKEYHITIVATWLPQDIYQQCSGAVDQSGDTTESAGLSSNVSPKYSAYKTGLYASGQVTEFRWQSAADGAWFVGTEEEGEQFRLQPETRQVGNSYQFTVDSVLSRNQQAVIFDKAVLGCGEKNITVTTQPQDGNNEMRSLEINEDYFDEGGYLLIPLSYAGSKQQTYTISWQ